jgi:hypothetical protein
MRESIELRVAASLGAYPQGTGYGHLTNSRILSFFFPRLRAQRFI